MKGYEIIGFCLNNFSGKLHTAAGAKHGAHHWYPDLEYMRQNVPEGKQVKDLGNIDIILYLGSIEKRRILVKS